MSIQYCKNCDREIDTDFNVEHFDDEMRCVKPVRRLRVNPDLLNKNNAKLCGEFIDIIHAYETNNGLIFGFNIDGFYSHVRLTDKNLSLMPNFNLENKAAKDLLIKYGLINTKEA